MGHLPALILASLIVGGAAHAKIITCEKSIPSEDNLSRVITKLRVEAGLDRNEVAFMNGEILDASQEDAQREAPEKDPTHGTIDKTEKIYMPNVTCTNGGNDSFEFNCRNNNKSGLIDRIEGRVENSRGSQNVVVYRTGFDERTEIYRFHISQCQVE